jgi:hypothetical protein
MIQLKIKPKFVPTVFHSDRIDLPDYVIKEKLLFDMLEADGAVFFGSRAWGGANDKSDYDYVLPAECIEKYIAAFKDSFPYGESKYYVKGVRIHCSKNVNITGCKKNDLLAWRKATEMMLSLQSLPMEKKSRHLLFESILAMLKQLL